MSDLLEKVISTSTLGAAPSGGGLLSPKQSDRFIDYMWDATTLAPQVRTVKIRENEISLDRMAIGERLVRLATEAVDDAVHPSIAFTKVSIRTEKFRLDWELSSESLEDGLEGEALEDHIARLMSAQAANDLEDLAINGDVTKTTEALIGSFDGWRKRLYAGGQVVDAAGANLNRGTFNNALRALPRKYMQNGRGNLKFFTSAGLLQDYLFDAQFVEGTNSTTDFQRPAAAAAAGLNTPNVANGNAGWSPVAPFGVRAQEVPLFPEYSVSGGTGSDVWLVDPNNLVWVVKREITVYREFKPRKDTIEYTMYTRVGCGVEDANGAVVVKNVKYKS